MSGNIDARKIQVLSPTCSGAWFIAPNPAADAEEPLYELSAFSDVNRYAALIDRIAREIGIDARLVRAIMYVETTHGYYDAPLAWIGRNKSLLPVNVNVAYWGDAFGDRRALHQPAANIKAGAEILFRIKANLPTDASVAQIATLYNNLNARQVSRYGARVDKVYNEQPWHKK